MFKYFFNSTQKKNTDTPRIIDTHNITKHDIITEIKNVIKEPNNEPITKQVSFKTTKPIMVYLVMNKTSQSPIGIFDNLEKAVIYGKKLTYNNCMVLLYKLNDECKYLQTIVFENK